MTQPSRLAHTAWICQRELSDLFGSPVAYVVVVLFLFMTGALFWLPFFDEVTPLSLRSFFLQAPVFLGVFVPALTMGMCSTRADVMMATLPVRELDVVCGKFLAVMVTLCIALAMTIPYPYTLAVLASQHGLTFDWGAAWSGYAGLMMLGAAYAGVGLMASSWSRDQIVSLLTAFTLCFMLYLLEQLAPLATTPWLVSLIEQCAPGHRLRAISRGVWRLSDVVYFASLTCATLGVARSSLIARRS